MLEARAPKLCVGSCGACFQTLASSRMSGGSFGTRSRATRRRGGGGTAIRHAGLDQSASIGQPMPCARRDPARCRIDETGLANTDAEHWVSTAGLIALMTYWQLNRREQTMRSLALELGVAFFLFPSASRRDCAGQHRHVSRSRATAMQQRRGGWRRLPVFQEGLPTR